MIYFSLHSCDREQFAEVQTWTGQINVVHYFTRLINCSMVIDPRLHGRDRLDCPSMGGIG